MTHTTRTRTAAGASLALCASVIAGSLASPALALPDKTVTRSNPGVIAIVDEAPAVPAASPVVVEPGFGRVTDVDVTLTGLNHPCPNDLLVTLLGPDGQSVVLIDDVGSNCSHPNGAVVTFDDEAATTVPPGNAQIAPGAYQPTDNGGPGPTPLLSTFDGQPAAGTWRLAIEDQVHDDEGFVAGWSIEIDYNDSTLPTGTVSIDGGAASTGATDVSLALATDPGGDSTGIAQVRFSNDGTTWSAFQKYAATAGWTLPAGDGTKTVWAQYADDIGNLSAPVTDTIVLDTTAPKATKPTPSKKATGVSVKTMVSFTANEDLDPSTITRRTVKLTANGTTVHAKVSYKPGKRKVTVTPQKELAAHRTYKVKISEKVTDLAGNSLGPARWTFTTG